MSPPAINVKCLAVIVVDMQVKFLSKLYPSERDMLVAKQSEILTTCTQLDVPVFVLEHTHYNDNPTVEALRSVISAIPRKKTIRKNRDDGFYGTTLHADLKKVGARSLILTGVNASFCVMSTATSAIERKYQMITAENLIADGSWKRDKNSAWYAANGTFFPDTVKLTK